MYKNELSTRELNDISHFLYLSLFSPSGKTSQTVKMSSLKSLNSKHKINLIFYLFQIVDGSREKGCSAQTGWGKLCAVSLDNFNGQAGSACPGDSGAPLVTFDTKNGGWTLIGLLSNGAKSCFKGLPEVYTKVGDYLDWIYKTMNENSVP